MSEKLSKKLLFTEESWDYDSALNGTSIKGSYSTMQFVLRLRDDIREALNKNDVTDSEKIQATSTAIHENIHWWQHIGSNFGFIYSLAYPAFSHVTKENLSNLISQNLTFKSILKFGKQYYDKYQKADIPDLNVVLNNYHDIQYAKEFAFDNKSLKTIIEDRRFFLHIGHCYHILWSSTVHTIAATIDQQYSFLPKTELWLEKFRKLSEDQVAGFYIDSPMNISPIGIRAIFEGQAMYNQMQYLSVANRDLIYDDFINAGMLHGIYKEAFELFLYITKIDKPINMLDSTVGLYLLVCDLAINPNNGFPLDIYDYKNFVTNNDPGLRFIYLCSTISRNPEKYQSMIKDYSKEEYLFLSKELSESIGCKCSYESIDIVLNWANENEVRKLLEEEEELKFSPENLPIRLMFSKYFRFQEDKKKYPNVFCWFGYHANNVNRNVEFEIVDSIYKKHFALFLDDSDGEIKPTIFEGKKEENIMESFNMFYKFNILYDIVQRWVREEGEFKLDYKWIANKRAKDFIPTIKDEFKQQFNISIDDIKVL